MSLKKNIIVSYISQIYVAIIGILMVPVYISYMGAEIYGLIGFFAMLQMWFQLLDMGLTPTMARETAKFRGGGVEKRKIWALLRTLEVVFLFIGLVGFFLVYLFSDFISSKWLKINSLNVYDVNEAIVLMGGAIVFRWMSGLYKGVVSGFEKISWLGWFNILIASLKFVAVLPVILLLGGSPFIFFSYQLIIAFIEMLFLLFKSYREMPKRNCEKRFFFDVSSLRDVVRFSSSIAFTSSVWIITTQSDKLILSKVLTLSDYGVFTVAVLAASGVLVASTPVSSVLMSRLTVLATQSKEDEFLSVYRKMTQLVCVGALSIAVVLTIFSKQVLLAWTGDKNIAENAYQVLSLYALGNGILALTAFPYYLQYAKGDLKLHLLGNVIFVSFLIPLIIAFSYYFGAIGAGWVWCLSNLIYFLFWVPKVHHKFFKNLHANWILIDILPILAGSSSVALFIFYFMRFSEGRWYLIFELFIIGISVLVVSVISSAYFIAKIGNILCLKK